MPYLQIQVSDSVYAKIEKLRKSKYQRNDLVEVAVAKVFEKDENFIDFISTFRIDLKTIEKVPMAISLRKEIYSYFESLSNQTEIQLGFKDVETPASFYIEGIIESEMQGKLSEKQIECLLMGDFNEFADSHFPKKDWSEKSEMIPMNILLNHSVATYLKHKFSDDESRNFFIEKLFLSRAE